MNDYVIGYQFNKDTDTIFPIRKNHFIVDGNFYFRSYKTYNSEYLAVPQVLYFNLLPNVKTFTSKRIEGLSYRAKFQMRAGLYVSALGIGVTALILADAFTKNNYTTAIVGVPFGIGITTGGVYIFKNAIKKKNIYDIYKTAKKVKL
jgi:hypothetical protein